MKSIVNDLAAIRNEHRVLGLMFILLHLALWSDFTSLVSRSLLLAHFGLFLLWQPLWRREHRFEWDGLVIFAASILTTLIWLNWWLVGFWLILLCGLIGGRAAASVGNRTAAMAALLFLICELLIGVIPPMFAVQQFSSEVRNFFGYVLLIPPAALLLIKESAVRSEMQRSVDFFYGLTIALLVCTLALGTLLAMYHNGVDYVIALFQTVLAIAFLLLAISWLWMPVGGFAGLGQLWTRSLLNIGTPFERWLADVSTLAAQHQSPTRFLDSAVQRLLDLPWIDGVSWRCNGLTNHAGNQDYQPLPIRILDLEVAIHTRRELSAGLQLHAKLLVQLISDFYIAKEREQKLAQHVHVQAVYETGARLTHDIKNLLQSLLALTTAVGRDDGSRTTELHELIRKQLPGLSQRLSLTLDKLQRPNETIHNRRLASEWWDALKRRHASRNIRFESELVHDSEVVSDVYDSVAENLIDNALNKQKSEPETSIDVKLELDGDSLALRVRDSGHAIEKAQIEHLFEAPVASNSGYGIGLYQSARQAREIGLTLNLVRNDEAGVEFALEGPVMGGHETGSEPAPAKVRRARASGISGAADTPGTNDGSD